MDDAARAALDRLDVFVGEWSVDAEIPNMDTGGMRARTTFEWVLDRTFLLERSEVPHPAAPDGLAVIGLDPRGEAEYAQHYFDDRGVIRIYAMTFEDGLWTLRRDRPDFSPLDFWQRFTGRFNDDRNTLRGPWENSEDDGATWELDFELIYTRTDEGTAR